VLALPAQEKKNERVHESTVGTTVRGERPAGRCLGRDVDSGFGSKKQGSRRVSLAVRRHAEPVNTKNTSRLPGGVLDARHRQPRRTDTAGLDGSRAIQRASRKLWRSVMEAHRVDAWGGIIDGWRVHWDEVDASTHCAASSSSCSNEIDDVPR